MLPGEQAEHDVVARLERVEQLAHAGEDVLAMVDRCELVAQQGEVSVEHQVEPRLDVAVDTPGVAHQLAHDLRIGLAVEAMLARPALAEVLLQRLEDRAPAGAVGPEDGPVDVEQHEATETGWLRA
jgi:hypothetical protein